MSATALSAPSISTPCIRICVVEPNAGLCRGCGRTLEEIGAWSSMSEAQRRATMAELPNRLRHLNAGN